RLSFLLLFYCYVPPRDLHSFPTRRSSDLRRNRTKSLRVTQRATHASARFEMARAQSSCADHRGCTRSAAACRRATDRRHPSATRSEEHTSELQSRGHLVCRLLLEKKKKKT